MVHSECAHNSQGEWRKALFLDIWEGGREGQGGHGRLGMQIWPALIGRIIYRGVDVDSGNRSRCRARIVN